MFDTNWVCLIWCPLLYDMYCADLTLQWETRLTGSHEGAYYPRSSKSIYCLIRRCNFLSSCRDTSKDDKRFKIVRVGASPTRVVIGTGKKNLIDERAQKSRLVCEATKIRSTIPKYRFDVMMEQWNGETVEWRNILEHVIAEYPKARNDRIS